MCQETEGDDGAEVRAVHRLVHVEGQDPGSEAALTKTFYPAQPLSKQKNPFLPPPLDPSGAPFPVIILLNGYNTSYEVYQWLALRLVLSQPQRLVVVTTNWLAPGISGAIVVNPGAKLSPQEPAEEARKVPYCRILPTLLKHLSALNEEEGGILQGSLKLDSVVLGGHSLGGWLALGSATHLSSFPALKAAFSYGTHTGRPLRLGFPPLTFAPLPTSIPLMIIGGSQDGILGKGASAYGGDWDSSCVPLELSFEGLQGGHDNQYLFLLEGANHYLIAHPLDQTNTGPALDWPPQGPLEEQREQLARGIELFIGAEVVGDAGCRHALDAWLASPPPRVLQFRRK